jgi:hypothetical protein
VKCGVSWGKRSHPLIVHESLRRQLQRMRMLSLLDEMDARNLMSDAE